MKKYLFLILVITALLLMSSCSANLSADDNSDTTEASTTEEFLVDPLPHLKEALSDKLEGKELIEKEYLKIDRRTCKVFSLGTTVDGTFTEEERFAVAPDGTIYALENLSGTNWYLYPLDK